MENNLYKSYKEQIIPKLMEELGLSNIMQVPKVAKISINVGVGKHLKETNYIENVEKTLRNITGQKPVRTKAKKAISNFKIRAGMDIGVMVTLRGKRMYDFLEKLLSITMPRMRDFRGISDKSFDKDGNYTWGIKEHLAFPEIKADEVDKIHGMEITVCTTAKDADTSRKLLTYLGFPFKK